MNTDKNDMLEMALRICRGYLPGPWKKITANDITLSQISGGLSNLLYHVTLNKTSGKSVEPTQVLLRLYGHTMGERPIESLITDSVIFTLLSERNLGPRLHGIFPGGRIEEYIPARPIKSYELHSPSLTLLVADRMAAIHSMNVPINKEPRWLWDTMIRWHQNIEEGKTKENVSQTPNTIEQQLNLIDLKAEMVWLKSHLTKLRSPVVFCHNDLQGGNILLLQNTDEENVVIIDYEYCSYNYRAYDLANHFIEWTFDYSNPVAPNFFTTKENYPSRSQMVTFLERYISHFGQTSGPVNYDAIITEIQHFTMASHLFWGMWSIVSAKRSHIPFGYWEYAKDRIDSYYSLKAELIGIETGLKRKAVDLD
uniref:Choline/ethanolamine kinase n=1 Tax=Clastoptera arizonana TaxID=38151 RepID=A0A1B6CGP1_9HEMI